MKLQQRGGFVIGLIVGLLIGLGLALGVALYVNKVPAPFVNKVMQRNSDQDAAEVEKNKNWDPNAPLYGKNPARNGAASAPDTATVAPAPGAATVPTAPQTPPATAAVPATPGANPAASAASAARRDTRDPAAILADRPAGTAPGADPFTYFVQAGAYGRAEDAEQQRAKLAMLGYAAKVTEREQSGRTVYRVRLGPYDKKDDANVAKDRLDGSGVESALVRVQKSLN